MFQDTLFKYKWTIHAIVLCLFVLSMLLAVDLVYGIENSAVEDPTVISLAINAFCIMVCGFVYITIVFDNKRSKTAYFLLASVAIEALLLLCDIINWTSEGHSSRTFEYNLTCVGKFELALIVSILFWRYQMGNFDCSQLFFKHFCKIILAILIFGSALILTNPLTDTVFYIDDNGNYHRGQLWLLYNALPVIVLTLSAGVGMVFGKTPREKFASATYLVIPIAAIIAQNVYEGISVLYSSLVLVILVVYGNFYVSRGEELAKKEAELENERFIAMFSQIQPHFLYNSLTSIMAIEGNPPETQEAIAEFGVYLRGNLNSVDSREPIPFGKELEHVENYVTLEKRRFKEKLNVIWHINDTRFALPALTLQMLVENAIKHGVTQKEEGGTIHIVTELAEEGHLLKVIDDGVGFDKSKSSTPVEKTPEGLKIIKNRLETMVNGSISIKSVPGRGTTVTVIIPEKK